MPTFNDPSTDLAEARAGLRGLARCSQCIDNSDALYGIVGGLVAATRSLEQSLTQLGGASLMYQGRATHDDGDRNLGAAESTLDQASGNLRRIAWQSPRNGGVTLGDRTAQETTSAALEQRQERILGDGSWFTLDRIVNVARNRGLER